MSQTYRVLPSDILGLDDDLAAYCANRATAAFGQAVDAHIMEATEGKKKEQAQAIAENVVAIWTKRQLKFASPTATR